MSKKKAVDYYLSYLHPKKQQYVTIEFLDKKGRTMMSSVDVLLNSTYLSTEDGEWDLDKLRGFVKTR